MADPWLSQSMAGVNVTCQSPVTRYGKHVPLPETKHAHWSIQHLVRTVCTAYMCDISSLGSFSKPLPPAFPLALHITWQSVCALRNQSVLCPYSEHAERTLFVLGVYCTLSVPPDPRDSDSRESAMKRPVGLNLSNSGLRAKPDSASAEKNPECS